MESRGKKKDRHRQSTKLFDREVKHKQGLGKNIRDKTTTSVTKTGSQAATAQHDETSPIHPYKTAYRSDLIRCTRGMRQRYARMTRTGRPYSFISSLKVMSILRSAPDRAHRAGEFTPGGCPRTRSNRERGSCSLLGRIS
jgi:hypothetical protein